MAEGSDFSSALLRALLDTFEEADKAGSPAECSGIDARCIMSRGVRFDFGGVTIERLVVEFPRG